MPSSTLRPDSGDETVLDAAEIAGDQREQIGRLRERIVPDGVVPAAGKVAALDRVAVGKQQRRFAAQRLDADRVDRENVRAVEEIGDAAKAFGLALRAIDAARAVEPHQRLVVRRRDLGLDRQAGNVRPAGGVGMTSCPASPGSRRRQRLSVDLDALQQEPVAVEHQRRVLSQRPAAARSSARHTTTVLSGESRKVRSVRGMR